MTSSLAALKDLRKFVDTQQQHVIQKQTMLFERFRNKPFWIWNVEEHKAEHQRTKGDCCFNHIAGLPTKDGIEKPMFPYEKTLEDALFIDSAHNPLNHAFKAKHLYILKSGGLGVTEYFLRTMAWLAVRNDDYRNTQMVVVTGPNQDIAIKLIKRMKALFEPKLGIIFQDKETSLQLNGCNIDMKPNERLTYLRRRLKMWYFEKKPH